jgi:PST family polysaccharide transporter
LIGHAYGSAALGLYSRAYNLLMMPVNQIHQPMARIAVPVLSYLQDQPERFRKYFRTAVSAVAYLAMPLITTVAALAHETITIVLGSQWVKAAPLFQVLAIAGTINILRNPNGWVFTSLGRAGRQSTWALINRPIMVLGFVLGLHWGAIGVAWAYTITNLVLYVPGCLWAVKDSPLTLLDIWRAGWRPLLLSLATFAAAFACHRLLTGSPAIVIAVAGFAAAAVIMVLAVVFWAPVRSDIATLRNALSRQGGSNAQSSPEPTPSRAAEGTPAPSDVATSTPGGV